MEFEIKNLTLYNDLVFTKDETNPVLKSEELSVFTNKVRKNDTNPDRHLFLTDGSWSGYGLIPQENLNDGCKPDGVIPKGMYLFVQFFIDAKDERIQQDMKEAAAEALYLESLWQELPLDDTIFVRTLDEGGKKVCQLFRGTSRLPVESGTDAQ